MGLAAALLSNFGLGLELGACKSLRVESDSRCFAYSRTLYGKRWVRVPLHYGSVSDEDCEAADFLVEVEGVLNA